MDHSGSERATNDLEREWADRKAEVSRALDAAVRDAIAAVLDSAAEVRRAMDAQAGQVLDRVRDERERLNREVAALGRERDGLSEEITATRRAAEDDAARIREGAEGERADLLRDAEQRKVELTAEIQRLEQQLVEVSSGIQALLQEQIGRVRAGLPRSEQLWDASPPPTPPAPSRPASAPSPTVSRPPPAVPAPPAPEPEPTIDSLFDDTLTVGEVDQLSHELGLTEQDEEEPALTLDEIEIEVGDLAADRTIDAAEPEEPIGLEPLDELESVDVEDEESLDAAILGIEDGSSLADELANLGVEAEGDPAAPLESEEELELALETEPSSESDDDLLADFELDQPPDPTEAGVPAGWPSGGVEAGRGVTVSQAQQDAFAALAASFERRARAEAAAVGPVDQQIEVPEPARRVTPIRDAADAGRVTASAQPEAVSSPSPARATNNAPHEPPAPARPAPQPPTQPAPRAGESPRQASARPAEGGASQRVEVAVTGTPSFARALELQRGIQRTAGVKQVQALQFERGTLVLAVEHDASVDLPGVLLALPNNLEMVDASGERLELRFPKA